MIATDTYFHRSGGFDVSIVSIYDLRTHNYGLKYQEIYSCRAMNKLCGKIRPNK